MLGVIAALLGTAELMSITVPSGVRDLVWFAGLGALVLTSTELGAIRESIERVNSDAFVQVGAGIWLLYLGASILFLAGVLLLERDRTAPEAVLPDGVLNET